MEMRDVRRLYQWQVKRSLGDGAIVWINPARINAWNDASTYPVTHKRFWGGRGGIAKVLTRWAEPFAIPSSCFSAPIPVLESDLYARIADFMHCGPDVMSSSWAKMLLSDLAARGNARHKAIEMRSADDIERFLRGYASKLVRAMAQGYDMSRPGGIGSLQIGPSGEFIKSASARHRFAIARLQGITRFPLQVTGAHENWLEALADGRGVLEIPILAAAIAERARAFQD